MSKTEIMQRLEQRLQMQEAESKMRAEKGLEPGEKYENASAAEDLFRVSVLSSLSSVGHVSRFNKEQKELLLQMFEKNPRPTISQRQEFAKQLGLENSQVDTWFNNERSRRKRDAKAKGIDPKSVELDPGLSESAMDTCEEIPGDILTRSEENYLDNDNDNDIIDAFANDSSHTDIDNFLAKCDMPDNDIDMTDEQLD